MAQITTGRTVGSISVAIAVVLVTTVIGAEPAERTRPGLDDNPLPSCTWSAGFSLPGFDGPVVTSVVWDDGTGPALYVGGEFRFHGTEPMPFAARWNGVSWDSLVDPSGIGVNGPVHELVVYDDGSGEALYAGGSFTTAGGEIANGVARWDGRRWLPLLGDSGVGLDDGTFGAMAVHDFGYGNVLTVGGGFETAGGKPVNNIALWDGVRWLALSGYGGVGVNGEITEMAVAMDRLFVAHEVLQGFGTHIEIASWQGLWVPLHGFSAYPSSVLSLTALDDGHGEALYVAEEDEWGQVRRWDGVSWSDVIDSLGRSLDEYLGDPPIGPIVTSLDALDLGDGPGLYVGGDICWNFNGMDCINSMFVARWDGDWRVISGAEQGLVARAFVATMATMNTSSGEALVVGGRNLANGDVVLGSVGAWNRVSWSGIGRTEGQGVGGHTVPRVESMASFNQGSGRSLVAAGPFTTVGDTVAVNIARWRDGEWSDVSDSQGNGACAALGCSSPTGLVVLDDFLGSALYAVAVVPCSWSRTSVDVARWDGTAWSRSGGTGCDYNYVNDVTSFDDGSGSAIFGAGLFAAWNETVMKFNGWSWRQIPGSGGYPPGGEVKVLEGWDHGVGKGLYMAGDFTEIGGLPTDGFVRWDGSQWSVPEGPPGVKITEGANVRDMVLFDDGGGVALYVGGARLNHQDVGGVVKWDGSRWWPVDHPQGRIPGNVTALTVFNDGTGKRLYVASNDRLDGGGVRNTINRWDGEKWSVIADFSTEDSSWYVRTLFSYDNGDDDALWLGGAFTEIDGIPSSGVARLECRPPTHGAGAVRHSGGRVSP